MHKPRFEKSKSHPIKPTTRGNKSQTKPKFGRILNGLVWKAKIKRIPTLIVHERSYTTKILAEMSKVKKNEEEEEVKLK